MRSLGLITLVMILVSEIFPVAPCDAKAPAPRQSAVLDELFKIAFENNPDLIQQNESLRMAQAQLSLAYSSLYPKLSASSTLARTNNGDAGSTLSFRADQTLFNGGAEYSTIAQRRFLMEAEKAKLDDARDLARYAVINAMLNGSLAQEKLSILESNIVTQKARLNELRRLFRLGQAREPDMIQADLEMQQVQREAVDAQGDIDLARRDLSLALHKDLARNFEFPELDQLVAEVRFNPSAAPREGYEVQAIQSQIDAADYDLKSTWRSALPTVGAYALASPVHGSNASGYEIGLTAQWTLFEGLKTPHEIELVSAERAQLESRLESAKYTHQKNLEQLRIDRDNAVAKLRDLRQNVELAEKALKQQQLDYRRRIITSLEVQSSLESVLDLNLEQAELRYKAGQLRAESIKTGAAL
jgi:outer membrane protein